MASELAILNVHTPTNSFAIPHSVTVDSYQALVDKLTRKVATEYPRAQVGPGWVKYEWNASVWSLDDDSDYTIFAWRQKSEAGSSAEATNNTPTLYVHDPSQPVQPTTSYRNPSFYLFRRPASRQRGPSNVRPGSSLADGSVKTTKTRKTAAQQSAVPKHKVDFDKFHSENGVRTVIGTIGPVNNVRMLLKEGHRHVYVSRKFAVRHHFVPGDAEPGFYGYSGLVNIGKWPVALGPTPSIDGKKPTTTTHSVFLSEESHFDVILGRSFFEARRIKINAVDPTDVVCCDSGEKIDCEVVILRDGRGEIVTVT